MKKQIKFRQPKRNEKGEWMGFHYWGFIDGAFIGPVSTLGWPDSEQFTGFKDRNGKDIYEGDELRRGDSDIFYVDLCGARTRIDTGSSGINMNRAIAPYQYEDFEITGNIHQNPEIIANE